MLTTDAQARDVFAGTHSSRDGLSLEPGDLDPPRHPPLRTAC